MLLAVEVISNTTQHQNSTNGSDDSTGAASGFGLGAGVGGGRSRSRTRSRTRGSSRFRRWLARTIGRGLRRNRRWRTRGKGRVLTRGKGRGLGRGGSGRSSDTSVAVVGLSIAFNVVESSFAHTNSHSCGKGGRAAPHTLSVISLGCSTKALGAIPLGDVGRRTLCACVSITPVIGGASSAIAYSQITIILAVVVVVVIGSCFSSRTS